MSEINWQQVLGPLLSSKSPAENDGSNSTEIANRGVISASEVVELDRARWAGLIQRPVALAMVGPMALASWALLQELPRRGV